MNNKQNGLEEYSVTDEYADMTVAEYLKNVVKISSRRRQQLFYGKNVFLNGKSVHSKRIIRKNDVIGVKLLKDKSFGVKPEAGPLEVLYEDEAVIVVNKPANMLVHPTGQTQGGTLSNYLAGYFHKKGETVTIRPLHRLDRDTTGCVLFAKGAEYQEKLELQLKNNDIHRIYQAVVVGTGIEKAFPDGCINKNIGIVPGKPNRRQADDNGKRAVTHFKVLKQMEEHNFLELWLETGRTHQIRVHLAYAGYPVLGDRMYGTPSKWISHQALHASEIHFMHPISNALIKVNAPMTTDMNLFLVHNQ